jgi:hypothetical protein
VRKNQEWLLRRPKLVDKYRQAAGSQEKLKPFYDMVTQKIDLMHYKAGLVFNFDETSLMKKKQSNPKVITRKQSEIIRHALEEPLIKHCTACFCIAANGDFLPSALILPSIVPSKPLENYDTMNLTFYQSDSGFIDRNIFRKHIIGTILPKIKERQLKFSKTKELAPALLFLDGHPSRFCLDIWIACKLQNVDVCILPPHTSHLTQPLDCSVNARFKSLLGDLSPLPKKKDMDEGMEKWLTQVEHSITKRMDPDTIVHAFQATGLYPPVRVTVLHKLPVKSECAVQTRRKKIDIGGKLITDEDFLGDWSRKEFERKTETAKPKQDRGKKEGVTEKGDENENEKEKEMEKQKHIGNPPKIPSAFA